MSATIGPLVSVIIPAYNAAPTIQRAIDSALAQTYPSLEIIVIDDGSHDETSELVASYGGTPQLIHLPRNLGESGAMNEGIAAARGEYIAFLDADDEWLPGKLAKQVEVLRENPKAVLVTCGCNFVNPDGTVRTEFGTPPVGFSKGDIWRALLAETYIAKPCVLARSDALRAVGPFDTSLLVAADQDMWIRLAMTGEIEFIRECFTLVHDTPGSLTKVYAKKFDKFVLPMIARHIERRRADLSRGEVRRILGARCTSVGRSLYRTGAVFRGGWLMARAIKYGHDRASNLWYFAAASVPAIWAKRIFRSKRASQATAPPAVPAAARDLLLGPAPDSVAAIPPGPPILIVSIDTEAEFDWTGPFLRTHTNVLNLDHQWRAQEIFDRFGVQPMYLVDYAVATQPQGFEPLLKILRLGRCEIGAHLQAWENPPFDEELSERTSYAQNLPAWLQKEKLQRLTEAITANFGVRPTAYRAGRYGVGEEIAGILASLGYQIELSVLPGLDLSARSGPDFRRTTPRPYWFGRDRTLLEIPLTASFVGLLAAGRETAGSCFSLYHFASQRRLISMHLPGALARLGLLERITLTPEGMTSDDLLRLTKSLLRRGHRVFTFSYHSSSLLPGGTSYVRSQVELEQMLAKIEAYIRFFLEEIGGVAMTPTEFRSMLVGDAEEARVGPSQSAALAR